MMQPAARILYGLRSDGLGTRLIALGWLWRLARRLEARAVIAWPPTPKVLRPQLGRVMPLEQLFDMRAIACAETELRFVPGLAVPLPEWPALATPGVAGPVRIDPAHAFDAGPILTYRGYHSLLIGDEALAAARCEVSALLKTLPLAPALQAAIDAVLAQAAGAPFVAVHLRRGDIVAGLGALGEQADAGEAVDAEVERYLGYFAHKSTPLPAFFRCVEREIAAGRRIYLATDDGAMRDRLRAIHGDAVFGIADAGLPPIAQAMADIVIQSHAHRILASASGFATAAALYGARARTSPPIDDGAEAFVADLDQLLGERGVSAATRAGFAVRLRTHPLLTQRLGQSSAG